MPDPANINLRPSTTAVVLGLLFLLATVSSPSAQTYHWTRDRSDDSGNSLRERIPPPPGFLRTPVDSGSFDEWLHGLPLRQGKPAVLLYNGHQKSRQDTHHAIVDIDIGTRDLQQCADACIRLFAEYAWSQGRYDDIAFDFTSGDPCRYADWRAGNIPDNIWQWVQTAWPTSPDTTYGGFRRYLDIVFMYAGSVSLEAECDSLTSADSLSPGDMILQPGFPGHVCMIVDVARDRTTGEPVYLLLEGFTPAQNLVILRNAKDDLLSPWFRFDCPGRIVTPDWQFDCQDLRRRKEP